MNLKGEVVGVNTAIVTTSGSNAGIGFAVPSDQVEPAVTAVIKKDRIENGERPKSGFMGCSIVHLANWNSTTLADCLSGNLWVSAVVSGSPADQVGVVPLQILQDGQLQLGDCIVAVGGKTVETFPELQKEMDTRVDGEEVAITLADAQGERRVVYMKLESK